MELKNNLSTLPDEMVNVILHFLDDYSIMQMLSVSRKFNKIIQGEGFIKSLASHREYLYNILSAKNDQSIKARAEKRKLGYTGAVEYYKNFAIVLKKELQEAYSKLESIKSSELINFAESLKNYRSFHPATLASNMHALGVHIKNNKRSIAKISACGFLSLVGAATALTLLVLTGKGILLNAKDNEQLTGKEFLKEIVVIGFSVIGFLMAILAPINAVAIARSHPEVFNFHPAGYLNHPVSLLNTAHAQDWQNILKNYQQIFDKKDVSYITDIINSIEEYKNNLISEDPLMSLCHGLIEKIDVFINLLDTCKDNKLPLKKIVETKNELTFNANSFFKQYVQYKDQVPEQVAIDIEDRILNEKTPLLRN